MFELSINSIAFSYLIGFSVSQQIKFLSIFTNLRISAISHIPRILIREQH